MDGDAVVVVKVVQVLCVPSTVLQIGRAVLCLEVLPLLSVDIKAIPCGLDPV